ncbi:polysaccharide deacetylase family protein [Cyclobacterium jeungdonense]|uniref:Polysaccharide deacetylase family protein n=1 Tax=Cyclobacterium jeungdonense TaxID=708087 RepID=A0ABT8C4Q7_9BACT|nr:polysaccharide deacetylase family protein [Cyclobacterium jeungdonense]MDN3687773.1 polysaccharide deacetylase family protein [Cyclobacterium jeungdonense]
MKKDVVVLLGLILIFSCSPERGKQIGVTNVTKWKDDKKTAISITYDDGTINQFTVAKPIMDKFQMPGTFYIITGKIDGSQKGKFIGRPKEEIIEETKFTETNESNFFERASLIGFTGTTEGPDYHSRVGSLFEAGKIEEAYKLLDEGYSKIRTGEIKTLENEIFHHNSVDTTTWQDLKKYASEGHEIASHTVTHPRLAVLDEKNMVYELKQSKQDIEKFLGEKYTFSAECPYGTENERVMEYAHEIYPSLRNRMPEPYLEELNRSSNINPGESKKEYVQWQRGPLTNIGLDKMKEWVDTCVSHDNIWLVLVFHGVNGIGWEPRTGKELEDYFEYINDRREQIWVATFADVTKYIRERESAKIESVVNGKSIKVTLSSNLDPNVYDVPITLKTYVPKNWKSVSINKDRVIDEVKSDSLGNYITYSAFLGENEVILEENR